MSITSAEVARIANVSRSTVSRVINHYPNVPEETREKVLKVIREYDYQPNEMARALAGKASTEIGLFVLEQRFRGLVDANFTHRMIAELVRVCYDYQSALSVYLIQNENDFKNIRFLYQRKKICGGLFLGFEYQIPWLNSLILEGYNVAAIDIREEDMVEGRCVGYLNFDNETAGYTAVKKLIDSGRTHILHLAGDDRLSSVLRRQGYERAMREAGLEDNIRIEDAEFDSDKAYDLTLKAMEAYPLDAVFAASDRMAIYSKRALESRGRKIPADIAVMGCDCFEGIAGLYDTNISSVSLPQNDLVDTAVQMLLGKKEPGKYLSEVALYEGLTL